MAKLKTKKTTPTKKIKAEQKLPLLTVTNLTSGYGTLKILRDISFTVPQKTAMLLMGPNGCGKSTLLKTIVGENKPWTATSVIQFKDNKWTRQNNAAIDKRINAGIGYLRQVQNVFTNLTVQENLETSLLPLKLDKQKAIEGILQDFPMLKGKLDKRAGLLSGGQRQALAIAMVLIKPCSLYLLDEPSAGLSPAAAMEIMECLKNFKKSHQDISILMVEHRLELLGWMDCAYVMQQGTIVQQYDAMKQALAESSLSEHYF
ncbi:MAG: ATP-binding cassette domain-containing protein [Alphaproteobacteria bacterium]|nr:ATP-binding cassette domain-containing protein [Alphaproteobacteria bacterium]